MRRSKSTMFSPILERLSRILYSPQLLAGLVFVVSLSLTYMLWRQARLDAVRELRSEFDLRARESVNMIEQRIAANGLVLRGVRGLFDSSVNVERDEFHNYVTSLRLDGRFLGMPSVGYAKLIDESRQNDLINDMRRQGYEDFGLQPAEGGGSSAIVVFLEPFFDGTGPGIGSDLYSDPLQRAAMEKARDTGGLAVTGRLSQNADGEGSEKSAFLMFVPLYRHEMPHEILAERRSHIVGWVFSMCLVDKMMEGIGGERAGDLGIEIYDGKKISDETRLYRYNRRAENVGSSDAIMFDKSWPIEFGGRNWTVFIRSLPAFEGRLNKGKPLIISTAGVVLSLLLTLLIRSLMLAKRMASDLKESEKRFRIIFEQAAVGVAFIETASGVFLNVNRRYSDILNLPAGEMNEASLKAITDPDDWQAEAEEMEKLKTGKIRGYTLEKRHFRRDGSTVWVNLTVSPMWGPGEQPTHHIAVMEDITERKLSEESMQLASLVYENSCEGMAVTDAGGNILNINPAFTEVTGYTEEEAIGKNPSILKSGRHDQAFFRAMWKSINTTGRWQGEIWNRRKSGEIFPEWLSINTIYNKDGTVHRRVALFSDITEKKKNDELIWCQANFDPLTGLPNRNMFYGRLEEEIKKKRRNGLPLALLFLDLDYFKSINDSLGHDKGDNLLKDAARRIRSCVRETDVVARLGGDEFIVILENLSSVERVAQDVLEKLSEPFMLGDDRACVSASIGIALYPEDAVNAEDLLRHADQAMYTAKAQGKNCFCYFTRSMREATLARMQLTDDMRLALADGQFRIHYQPIVDLKTGVVRKAEALVRWQHPARGMIGPDEFIEIAEETGMIIDIGDWIFREAAKQAACWRKTFRRDFQIGINKSAVQFYKNKDAGHAAWFEFLREQHLPFEGIVVEITEGLLLEASDDVSDQLLEFRSEGIQVSLDDFGTGYSSLSYLKKLSIDYLKIDRSFIVDLETNKNHLALCEAIIVMAHKLRIKVVAEGIENQKQCGLLTAAGCDFGQGYLFSEPVPPEEFEKLFFSV